MNYLTLNALLFIAFFFSCNTNLAKKKNESFKSIKSSVDLKRLSNDCRNYIKNDFNKSWKFNNKGNCYYDSKGIRLSLIKNEECFKKFSSEELSLLLGQANNIFRDDKSDGKILIYYLGESCEKYYPYWTMQFIYNERDSLLRIGMDQISIE